MKIVPETVRTEVSQQQESKWVEYSLCALENMHDFAEWRIMQLEYHRGVLSFLGNEGGELADLFNLAERIDRTKVNHERFQRIERELLYEIHKRR